MRIQTGVWVLLISLAATAQNATTAGAVTTPHPTLINLAVEWAISGDDNEDGVVAVEFREVGETQWRDAMPLRRVPAGTAPIGPTWTWPNKHSGSIFNLKPDTEYEIHLTLTDPDGGDAEQTVTARTRPVPRITASSNVQVLNAGNIGNLSVTSGTQSSPNVYHCPTGGARVATNLAGKQWVHLEGLTIIAKLSMTGAKNCVVRRCTLQSSSNALLSGDSPGATDCYIADNVVIGPRPWGVTMESAAPEGLRATGPGNVFCHNKIIGVSDAVSTWEGSQAANNNQYCIDVYNNDIYNCRDDGVEVDYGLHNVRVMRNRITNAFVFLSSQPALGGPVYFIQNVGYNIINATFKLHNWSYGNVLLHNTVVKHGDGICCYVASERPFEYSLFRNNLGIGGPSGTSEGGGSGQPLHFDGLGYTNDLDYDAVGSEIDPDPVPSLNLCTKAGGYQKGIREFGVDGLENNGLCEHHANAANQVQINMANTFENSTYPGTPATEYPATDLFLKSSSVVIDKGVALPNINEGYSGSAPDIGAYEYGVNLPPYFYGPRPDGVDEETMSYTLGVSSFTPNIKLVPNIEVYPNPFRNGANIFYTLSPGISSMSLSIFDSHGRRVRTLCKDCGPGSNSAYWNGKGDAGELLSGGIYFVDFNSLKKHDSKKLILVK